MSSNIRIAGAGLTGLIAGHAFRGAQIFESASLEDVSRNEHTALLRFRSDAVSKVTGIPFREVTVQKSIWDGSHVPYNIALGNMYSRKVLQGTGGKISGRSILNLEPARRFIAPPDFISRMREALRPQISYSRPIDFDSLFAFENPHPVISTVPLPIVCGAAIRGSGFGDPALGFEADSFKYAPIQVTRYKLDDVDLHQTIYFPSPDTDIYRASITGDTLIVEAVVSDLQPLYEELQMIMTAFGLVGRDRELIDSKAQQYGKVVDMPTQPRRALLRSLTARANIYSLGRFATWRNVLLDDVADDIEAIRRMIWSDAYGRELHSVSTGLKGDDFPF